MKIRNKLTLSSIALITTSLSYGQANSQLENRIERFWDIAEKKIEEKPISNEPKVTEKEYIVDHTHSPNPFKQRRHQHNNNQNQSITIQHKTIIPDPTPAVTIAQSNAGNKKDGHWGFTLFGGLKVFDFDWGSKNSSNSNKLSGKL